MKNRIISLRNKIDEVYNGDPWYGGSIKKILLSVDPKIVLLKQTENSHNIAELLAHIIGWREFVLSRLTGNHEFKIEQDESFNWKRLDKNENTTWQNLLNKLEKNQKEILKIMDEKDDNFLNESVSGRNYKMEYLIEGIILHDIYHLGQISLLNKLKTSGKSINRALISDALATGIMR